MLNAIRNFFHLKENKTTIATEVMAGFTTFMAMAYIIFVNPSFVTDRNGFYCCNDRQPVLRPQLALCLRHLLPNVLLHKAPGWDSMHFYLYRLLWYGDIVGNKALAIVLLSGILFLLVAISLYAVR